MIVGLLHGTGLPADDLADVTRQRAAQRLLIGLFRGVLSSFERVQNRLVSAAESNFGVDPRAMHGTGHRSRRLLVFIFANPSQFGLQLPGELPTLEALLVEIRLQIRAFHVFRSILIAFLSVFAGFNQVFEDADSIFIFHDEFLHSFDAMPRLRFGGIPRPWYTNVGRRL